MTPLKANTIISSILLLILLMLPYGSASPCQGVERAGGLFTPKERFTESRHTEKRYIESQCIEGRYIVGGIGEEKETTPGRSRCIFCQ